MMKREPSPGQGTEMAVFLEHFGYTGWPNCFGLCTLSGRCSFLLKNPVESVIGAPLVFALQYRLFLARAVPRPSPCVEDGACSGKAYRSRG